MQKISNLPSNQPTGPRNIPLASDRSASFGTEGGGPRNLIRLRFRSSQVGRKKCLTKKVGSDGEYCVISLDEKDESSATNNENTEVETETDYPPPKRYELVMLEKFEAPGRTLRYGSDPHWTALHNNYYTNDAYHFYSHDNSYTDNYGELVILTKAANTDIIGFEEVTKKAFVIQSTSAPT